jgi:hypothetical protein
LRKIIRKNDDRICGKQQCCAAEANTHPKPCALRGGEVIGWQRRFDEEDDSKVWVDIGCADLGDDADDGPVP